ncbi:MAG TPA: alpha/beta hydrolase family protein [Bacteroidales bacterium]|nr:alpha/beta hydrolase family protein [Bacteroidales bacterium]
MESGKKHLILFLVTVLALSSANAAVIDTLQVYSKTMKKNIPVIVVKPDNYESIQELPVVFLLHGHSGNYLDYISRGKGIGTEKLADQYSVLLVCPDGGFNSWYWDSPVDPASQYETFVSKELIEAIDTKYKTIKNRTGRAITGLSMGGHGALYLAFRHQDIFGAAGSMSGGVDIRPFPENWDMAKKLGAYAENHERWENNTVINMLHLLTGRSLAIIIDCGFDDFFFEMNENLHRQLLYRNIQHDYITRPGAHNWSYWTNSINYEILFFKRYFDNSKLTFRANGNR